MAVLRNYKICDNAKECGGVAVCPTGAISWDEENETIVIDNDKCICCGACERECPIGALTVVYTDEEYKKIEEEIENDPRTTKDLFVDRYGAAPLSEFFMITDEELDNKLGEGITLVEVYEDDSIQCLLKSIPIKELTKDMPKDTKYYKVKCTDSITKKYALKEYPSLLLFQDGKLIGKVEGYYSIDEKENFINKINEILK